MKYVIAASALLIAAFMVLASGPEDWASKNGNGLVWTGGKWARL